jgi:hypothetical protein
VASAVPYLAAIPLGLVLLATGAVGWRLSTLVILAGAAGALVRGAVRFVDLSRERARADDWIRVHSETRPSPAFVEARIDELVAPRTRRMLSKSLRGAAKAAAGPPSLGASPLNYAALRPVAPLIEDLADRLAQTDRPASPRGVLLSLDLLRQPSGPMYRRDQTRRLARSIRYTLNVLDEDQ